jgi:hypothetical protein
MVKNQPFELLTEGTGCQPVKVRCRKCRHVFTEFYDNLFTAPDEHGELTHCPICVQPGNVEYPQERLAIRLRVDGGYLYLGETLLARNNIAGRLIAKRMLSNRGFAGKAIAEMLRDVRGAA